MADNIQPGDTVELKSGSVPMTVESISRGNAMCVYEEEPGKLERRGFGLVALRKIQVTQDVDTDKLYGKR